MGRKSEAKKQLIQVAIQLIWENSYNTVSVDKLCKEVNVNKGSFYYFFPSKCALALEALDTAWESVKQEALDPAFSPDIPPLERFTRFFMKLYELQRKANVRVILEILLSWVLTLPIAAILSGCIYWILT